MTRAYSEDLRSRVIKEINKGTSCRRAAELFGVGPSTAIKWMERWRETGSYEAFAQGGDRRSRFKGKERDWLLQKIKDAPDMTLEELRQALKKHGITVGYGTVWRFFDREGISFKKNGLRHRAKTP